MGTVSRVHTFSAGSVLTAAQLNNEFDNLLTSSAINGGLDATNLGVTAGQVTASKGLVVDGSRNLDDTTSSNMINNLTLSGTLKLIDDQALTLGTNDDITVKYDETTNDALEIAAAVEGAALAVVLKADQGDDAGDEWKLGVADGGVLTLGNDIASAGTYVTGLTITPNSTTASWLLDFEGDVDVGGDTLSFNGAATIDTSGNNNLSLSAGTADVVVTASNLAPASNDGSAIGVSGTAWSDLFLASGAVVNFNAGDVTLTHSSNTLTVAGGTLATAALTASTITASGIIKTDDTTEATSTADGSLQTDGGLSVVKDAVFGDDVKLLSDSAVLALGDGSDATLTHDGTTGVTIAANPITVDSGAALTLDAHTGVFVFKDAGSEVLRFTEGNSGDVTVKLATNGKDLIFTDNGDATGLKVLDAAAGINVPGEVQTTKIAYTDGDDAITIADGGGATFSQTVTVGANGGGKDVQLYGATSGSNILLDASADDLILTNFGLAVGSDATGDVYYRDANGFLARLGVGSNGQVLTTNGTIPSWGAASDSGISFDGSTANGMLTYKDSDEATVESTLTFASDIMTATSTSSNLPIIRLKNTHNGATSGIIKFENDKGAAGADNDVCGTITFIGDDDNQDQTEFARIEGVVADASHGDECGALKLYVAENDGTNTVGLSLTGSTTDGEVDATIVAGTASVVTVPGHIDLAGDIDVDGTLEADAITIGGTAIGSIYGVVAGSSSIVTTGALDSGSITSNFGTIDTGSSAITTTGVITGGTVEATTDTAAGDNAAMGYTSAEGLILTGQGSTSDVTIKNDADATALSVPTGTTSLNVPLMTGAHTFGTNGGGSTAPDISIVVEQYATAESEGWRAFHFGGSSSSHVMRYGGGSATYNCATHHTFHTAADVSTREGTERMRIEPEGDVGIGTASIGTARMAVQTSTYNDNVLTLTHASDNNQCYGLKIDFSLQSPDRETEWFALFEDATTTRARCFANGDWENHDNSYAGISDSKLKQNVEDAREYWDDFKQIRFRKFKFKSDVERYGSDATPRFGVVAQEAESVFPSLVTESPDTEDQQVAVLDADGNATYEQTEKLDADGNVELDSDGNAVMVNKVDDDGNPIPITNTKRVDLGTTTKGFKYSILNQIGLKVVQELQARLEAAEAKIAALEAA